jgi:hypothetical protein
MIEAGGAEHVGKMLEARVLCTPHRGSGMLLLQHEGDLQVDLVALYVAVLYQDVHILHPRTFHASKRLGSTGDSLVDSVLETRLGRSANFVEFLS